MRLINADELDSVVLRLNAEKNAQITRGEYKLIDRVIFEFPTIDAKPVKHGHWVYDPDGIDWGLPAWKCSECHCRNDMIPTHIQGKDKMIKIEHPLRWAGSKYCPNCGAEMDEEGKEK